MAIFSEGFSCALCGEPIHHEYECCGFPYGLPVSQHLSFLADANVHHSCLRRSPFVGDVARAWRDLWMNYAVRGSVILVDHHRLLYVHESATRFVYLYDPRFLVIEEPASSLDDFRKFLAEPLGATERVASFPFGEYSVVPEGTGVRFTVTQYRNESNDTNGNLEPKASIIIRERFPNAEWRYFAET